MAACLLNPQHNTTQHSKDNRSQVNCTITRKHEDIVHMDDVAYEKLYGSKRPMKSLFHFIPYKNMVIDVLHLLLVSVIVYLIAIVAFLPLQTNKQKITLILYLTLQRVFDLIFNLFVKEFINTPQCDIKHLAEHLHSGCGVPFYFKTTVNKTTAHVDGTSISYEWRNIRGDEV